jgi:hypothetical protein
MVYVYPTRDDKEHHARILNPARRDGSNAPLLNEIIIISDHCHPFQPIVLTDDVVFFNR